MTSSVHRTIPPQRLVTALNPLVRIALRSPLHRLLDGSLLLLHVTGRRSGRQYDIPVGFVHHRGALLVITQHRWRANLRGGADVQVTRFGRRVAMHAELDEDPASVGATLRTTIDDIGRDGARRQLGLVIDPGSDPDVDELAQAATEFDLALVTLRPVE
ncbi:MAG: nitroreductase/quinone reductase family protein [Dermatophilaceae bacterium]